MPFTHQALRYVGTDGLLDGVLPYIREGLQRGEPVRVAARAQTLAPLREALGDAAVELVEIDHNPARIIPFWREFVEAHAGPVRGVGEPVWPGRGGAELVECQLHESLMNLAFVEDFTLLCPHDAEALDDRVLHEMCCSHPIVDGAPSPHYRADPLPLAPLPPPPAGARVLGFEIETLSEVRQLVRDAGGDPDFVLAVDEVAINSVHARRRPRDRAALARGRDARLRRARPGHHPRPARGPDAPGRRCLRRPRAVDRQRGLPARADPPRAP